MNISHISECDTDYTKKLSHIKTKEELLELLKEYESIAWDALDLVKTFDTKRFSSLLKSMASERKGKFSNSKDASIVMMPETMFKISLVADQFKVPFGLAFNRLRQVGRLEEKDNRYLVIPPKDSHEKA